jgi:hypothetical protein
MESKIKIKIHREQAMLLCALFECTLTDIACGRSWRIADIFAIEKIGTKVAKGFEAYSTRREKNLKLTLIETAYLYRYLQAQDELPTELISLFVELGKYQK